MSRGDRRKIIAVACGPSHVSGKKQRGWYHNINNCPPWWHGEDGSPIQWKSPNHPPKGAFLTVKEEIELLRSRQIYNNQAGLIK